MSAVSKNVNIDELDAIVDKYNNTYHRTIKIKPTDTKTRTYIDFDVENNDKDSKFKFGDLVKISNIKIFLRKVTLLIN